MTDTEPLLHPGLAMDDIFDLWEMMEADIAAGRPVDDEYRAAVAAEVARWSPGGDLALPPAPDFLKP